jgi:glycosyltransferase involved in cell wall biosynthesis
MKTIKVFGFPVHQTLTRTHGVDWARVIQPIQQLNGFVDGNVTFETYIWNPKDMPILDWEKICQTYDLIYLNYFGSIQKFVPMMAVAKNFHVPVIMDVDDDLWDIQKDNPAYETFKPGSDVIIDFSVACDEVDYMTTTCNYLRNVIMAHTKKQFKDIKVFPNYIDLSLYNHQLPLKDDFQITLLHHGSTTHFIDLATREFAEGIDRIMKDYPNVIFKTVGANISQYHMKWGDRYINAFGDEDLYKWVKDKMPAYMAEADIMVTPLQENVYTKGKSFIKYLENSSYAKPGCYQDIRQYREIVENGVDGFLCNTSEEWYNAIKKLIDDKKLRKQMGENAFKKVKENYTINQHVIDYSTFFKSVLE